MADKKLTLDEVQRDTAGLGGDRHAIVVDPESGMLYEFFGAKLTDAAGRRRARRSST